jgi:hypothetical protein
MPGQPVYYRPSGAFDARGLITMPIFGAVGALVSGSIYAVAARWVPFIYLLALFAIGAGALTGFLVGAGVRTGHVRNRMLILSTAVVAGLFTDYVAWVVWIRLQGGGWQLSTPVILKIISGLAETGAWSIHSFTPKGSVLWCIYATELGTIVLLAALAADATGLSTPYCERCHAWLPKALAAKSLGAIADAAGLTHQIESGDVSGLLHLGSAGNGEPSTTVELHACPQCQDLHLLSVSSVTPAKDKRGTPQTKSVLKTLIITRDQHQALQGQLNPSS